MNMFRREQALATALLALLSVSASTARACDTTSIDPACGYISLNPANANPINPSNPSNPNNLSNPNNPSNLLNPSNPLNPNKSANSDDDPAFHARVDAYRRSTHPYLGVLSFIEGSDKTIDYQRDGQQLRCHLNVDCPRSVYAELGQPAPAQAVDDRPGTAVGKKRSQRSGQRIAR